jgi:hypothetical protein
MWFRRLEQRFHPIFYVSRYTLKHRMVDPMLRSIFGERKFLQAGPGDVIIKV